MFKINERTATATIIAATVLVTVAGISHTQAKRHDPLSREEAIAAVVTQNPHFSPYVTLTSPQLGIETKETPSGWHVAFVKKAKDASTVEQAACYYASLGGTVSPAGVFTSDDETGAFAFDKCVGGDGEGQLVTAQSVAPPPAPTPTIETCTCPESEGICSRWAVCERQPGGQCALRLTPEYTACQANPEYANL